MHEFLESLSLIFNFYINYPLFYELPPKKLPNKEWSCFSTFRSFLVRSDLAFGWPRPKSHFSLISLYHLALFTDVIEELTECKHENACLNGGIQTQLDKLESRLDAGEAMNQQQNSGIYHIFLNSFRGK